MASIIRGCIDPSSITWRLITIQCLSRETAGVPPDGQYQLQGPILRVPKHSSSGSLYLSGTGLCNRDLEKTPADYLSWLSLIMQTTGGLSSNNDAITRIVASMAHFSALSSAAHGPSWSLRWRLGQLARAAQSQYQFDTVYLRYSEIPNSQTRSSSSISYAGDHGRDGTRVMAFT